MCKTPKIETSERTSSNLFEVFFYFYFIFFDFISFYFHFISFYFHFIFFISFYF